MRFVTSDPRTGGLYGRVGDTVDYVDTGAGESTPLLKFGPGDTDWISTLSEGGAEPVTADPRSAGLARPVGSRALYIPASGPAVMLYKYAAADTAWCTRAQPAPSGGVSSGSGASLDESLALAVLL